MKLSITSWSFPALTMPEVAGLAQALSIPAVDIGLFYASAMDKARVISDPDAYGRELRAALPVGIANYYHLFGEGLAGRNLALPPDPENIRDGKAALQFARSVGAPSVFVLPGMINPGQSRRQAFEQSVENLKPLVAAGQEIGVTLLVEPHVHGLLESVEMTHEMLDRVPGLKLALDAAHFTALGFRQDEIETLCPHAGHVHLRQSKQGELQTKMDAGTINFPALFGALREAGYDGWLAIEYVHQAYMNTLFDDVLTETVRMRDTFNAWNI